MDSEVGSSKQTGQRWSQGLFAGVVVRAIYSGPEASLVVFHGTGQSTSTSISSRAALMPEQGEDRRSRLPENTRPP